MALAVAQAEVRRLEETVSILRGELDARRRYGVYRSGRPVFGYRLDPDVLGPSV